MNEANVTHHVCTGTCGGVSPMPGTCQASGCTKHGESLAACDCTDGSHGKDVGAGGSQQETQL